MDTLKEYLDGLLSEQENAEVEFKHAHGGFPGCFWETYSAFANTNGGTIIFGVKEKNDQPKLYHFIARSAIFRFCIWRETYRMSQ